jgi:hypothetical protein
VTAESLDLKLVLDAYAVPDPSIVGKLPKRRKNPDGSWGSPVYLDYVGHADITKILIEVDPLWNWEPVAWEHGRPAITERDGIATLWVRLTLLGKTMLGCGSVHATKEDLDKELIGDALRNAAMRFGIALALWSNAEWAETETAKTQAPIELHNMGRKAPAPQRVPAPPDSPFGPTEKQMGLIKRLGWNGDPPATKLEASALIERLKAEPAQTVPSDEAPF